MKLVFLCIVDMNIEQYQVENRKHEHWNRNGKIGNRKQIVTGPKVVVN